MQRSQKSHSGIVWQVWRSVYVLLMKSGNASVFQETPIYCRSTNSAACVWHHKFDDAELSSYCLTGVEESRDWPTMCFLQDTLQHLLLHLEALMYLPLQAVCPSHDGLLMKAIKVTFSSTSLASLDHSFNFWCGNCYFWGGIYLSLRLRGM